MNLGRGREWRGLRTQGLGKQEDGAQRKLNPHWSAREANS